MTRCTEEDHWRRRGWSCLCQDEQAGARRKEREDRGRQHNEGKGMGHGGSGGLWVASLILWLESKRARASDGS